MSQLDYQDAADRLSRAFEKAESLVREEKVPTFPEGVESSLELIFSSGTQAYREVLIGCALAVLADASIDIRKPYAGQGPNSFNGRTLDEVVVNPFLHDRRVPSSRGPYLSTFRRSVDFTPATRQGVRDKAGFDALLALIEHIRSGGKTARERFLVRLLCGFVVLREASLIPLSKLNRASVTQYSQLIDGLLKVPSGGRLPVVVVISVLHAIKAHFSLTWEIDFQGINEADAAGGAGGDITVRDGETIVFAAEVTQREVDKSRVVATFNRKISPASIQDYIFFAPRTDDAAVQANQYFAQGSEVNFVDVLTWSTMSLVTMTQTGRGAFNSKLVELLDADDMPRAVKVAWNDLVGMLTNV